MIVVLGIIQLLILVACKGYFKLSNKKQTCKSLAKLTSYGTMDKISRISQYLCSLFVSFTNQNPLYFTRIPKQINVELLPTVEQTIELELLMGYFRKALRFFRCVEAINSLTSVTRKLMNGSYASKIVKYQEICVAISDINDIFFYFADHFNVFLTMGLVESKELSAKLLFFGDVAWIVGAVFLAFSACFKIFYPQQYEQKKQNRGHLIRINILQLIHRCLQFTLGFCFIYPSLLPRYDVCLIVLLSTSISVFKIWLQ